jgi:hypothetical protein
MDLSKLRPMSETPPTPDPPQKVDSRPKGAALQSTSAFLSIVLGLVFVLLGSTFVKWLSTTLTGGEFDTGAIWQAGEKAGQKVSYFELMGGTAWTDLGVFVAGLSLMLDGVLILIALRSRRIVKPLVIAAVGCISLAAMINLGVSGFLFSIGITPIFSLVAVAVLAYVVVEHWTSLAAPG